MEMSAGLSTVAPIPPARSPTTILRWSGRLPSLPEDQLVSSSSPLLSNQKSLSNLWTCSSVTNNTAVNGPYRNTVDTNPLYNAIIPSALTVFTTQSTAPAYGGTLPGPNLMFIIFVTPHVKQRRLAGIVELPRIGRQISGGMRYFITSSTQLHGDALRDVHCLGGEDRSSSPLPLQELVSDPLEKRLLLLRLWSWTMMLVGRLWKSHSGLPPFCSSSAAAAAGASLIFHLTSLLGCQCEGVVHEGEGLEREGGVVVVGEDGEEEVLVGGRRLVPATARRSGGGRMKP